MRLAAARSAQALAQAVAQALAQAAGHELRWRRGVSRRQTGAAAAVISQCAGDAHTMPRHVMSADWVIAGAQWELRRCGL